MIFKKRKYIDLGMGKKVRKIIEKNIGIRKSSKRTKKRNILMEVNNMPKKKKKKKR